LVIIFLDYAARLFPILFQNATIVGDRMKTPPADGREMPPLTVWKRLQRDIVSWPRRVTASKRVLPNMILLGTQRAGTTSIYSHLGRHPGVYLSKTKEVHYFDNYLDLGIDWYRSHFPTSKWVERNSQNLGYDMTIGEGSPYYLFHPEVPSRIHQTLPSARFVILLRNPVDRALSHFRHERRNGFEEEIEFQQAWDLEAERLDGTEERLKAGTTMFEEAHNRFSYTARGDYAPQLERWFALFDRSQFHIIRSEDMFEKPNEVMAGLFEFLGLPPVELGDFPRLNTTAKTPDTDEMEIRERLAAHYSPKIEELEALLGRSMNWNES